MPRVKRRTPWLLAILLIVSGGWGAQHWHSYILWPGQCNGDTPPWFAQLITLARQQGYPGFQLSLQLPDGSRLDCTAGQTGPGLIHKPMQTEHRMRYVSLSKVFTSVVSQQLITEGRLQEDALLLNYLEADGVPADVRIKHIRIGQLLRHTAGFDRSLTPDPMMQADPWCPSRLQELNNVTLDHEPGTQYAYSNLGYCLLGAVLEQIEGQSLQIIITNRLFSPAGVSAIQPAYSGSFATDEVAYRYQQPEHEQQLTAMPYASMLAVGAWTGTAADFLQVLSAVFQGGLLDDQSRQGLLRIDAACDPSQWRICHGNGFYAYQPTPDAARFYWRDGSLAGVTSFAGIGEHGQLVTFLANSRPVDWMPANDAVGLFLYRHVIEGVGLGRDD